MRKETVWSSKPAATGKRELPKLRAPVTKALRSIAATKSEQIRAPKYGKLAPWSPATASVSEVAEHTKPTERSKDASMTASPKRKAEDDFAPAAKKNKVDRPLMDKTGMTGPAPAILSSGAENTVPKTSAEESARIGFLNEELAKADESSLMQQTVEPPASCPTATSDVPATAVEKETPVRFTSKRKAEEDIEMPAKKSKSPKQPMKRAADKASSMDTGKTKALQTHERCVSGQTATEPLASDGKAGLSDGEERATGLSTRKTGDIKKALADKVKGEPSTTAQAQSQPASGKRPAPMANKDLFCFANSILQTIDSIPELRNRLIAKAALSDAAPAFPAFPVPKGLESDDEEAEADWHETIDQMLNDEDRTSVERSQLC